MQEHGEDERKWMKSMRRRARRAKKDVFLPRLINKDQNGEQRGARESRIRLFALNGSTINRFVAV